MEKEIMERNEEKEEVVSYTVDEFIKATRPDGFGYMYLNGKEIAAFIEVLCDACNAEITQPKSEPEAKLVHVFANRAWCSDCVDRWLGGDE
ncbi:MAG: hypothetical protein WCS52_05645 [bacterium]